MKAGLGDYTYIKTGKLTADASSDNGIYPFFTCSRAPLLINTYAVLVKMFWLLGMAT